MKTIDRDTAKQYIYKTNGKIFSAVFVKKDGEIRKMVCRQGVYKYVKGIGLKFKPVDPDKDRDLVGVFDMLKKAYRFINAKTLEQIKVECITYIIKKDKE